MNPPDASFTDDGSLVSLLALRLSIIAKLQSLAADSAHKPTVSVDGQTTSWSEYRDSLQKQLADVEMRIRRANSDNVPSTTVKYTNPWRGTYGRSPFFRP